MSVVAVLLRASRTVRRMVAVPVPVAGAVTSRNLPSTAAPSSGSPLICSQRKPREPKPVPLPVIRIDSPLARLAVPPGRSVVAVTSTMDCWIGPMTADGLSFSTEALGEPS